MVECVKILSQVIIEMFVFVFCIYIDVSEGVYVC